MVDWSNLNWLEALGLAFMLVAAGLVVAIIIVRLLDLADSLKEKRRREWNQYLRLGNVERSLEGLWQKAESIEKTCKENGQYDRSYQERQKKSS